MSIVRNCVNSTEVFPIKINISEDIKNQIRNYAVSDLSRELGGVLVGNVSQISDNFYELYIENFIIAEHTDAHLSSVTFTAETWSEINKQMDTQYPDSKIVGWFHTHPGFGIFLSNWDIFIQDNFFNIPWQIAYVVDPCHKTDGFFIWKNQEILKISEDTFDEELDINDIKSDIKLTEPVARKNSTSLNEYINIISKSKLNQLMSRYSKTLTIFLILVFFIIIIYIYTSHFGIDTHIKRYIKSLMVYFKDLMTLLK